MPPGVPKWGCQQGYHVPVAQPVGASAADADAAADSARWLLAVVPRKPTPTSNHTPLSTLQPPWRRMVVLADVPPAAIVEDVVAAAGGSRRVVAAFPQRAGRPRARPPLATSLLLKKGTRLSDLMAQSGAGAGAGTGTGVGAAGRKPPANTPPSTDSLRAAVSAGEDIAPSEPGASTPWYVEFKSVAAAQSFRQAVSRRDSRTFVRGVCASAALLPHDAQLVAAHNASSRKTVWLPLAPSATLPELTLMLAGRLNTSAASLAGSVLWPAHLRLTRGAPASEHCLRCDSRAAPSDDQRLAKMAVCRYHPGEWVPQLRVRQVLQGGKCTEVPKPTVVPLPAPPLPVAVAHRGPAGPTVPAKAVPFQATCGVGHDRPRVPDPEPDPVPVASPLKSPLPVPAADLTVPLAQLPVYPPLRPPAARSLAPFMPDYRKAPAYAALSLPFRPATIPDPCCVAMHPRPLPWLQLHALADRRLAGAGRAFMMVPVHRRRPRPRSARRRRPPIALASSHRTDKVNANVKGDGGGGNGGDGDGDGAEGEGKSLDELPSTWMPRRNTMPSDVPMYVVARGATRKDNTHLGMEWLMPVDFLGRPVIKVTVKKPVVYPGPAHYVVCDHHCVRRSFPVIRLPVKNTSPFSVVGTTHMHFADIDRALSFDRRRAYGYRLVTNTGPIFEFPPNSTTTVTLAVADPNFMSKTMMMPLSMLWKGDGGELAEDLKAGPRKRWQPAPPAGAPATVQADGRPVTLSKVFQPHAVPAGQRGVPNRRRNKQALWDTDEYDGATNDHVTASDMSWATPLNHATPSALLAAVAATGQRSAVRVLVDTRRPGGAAAQLRRTSSVSSGLGSVSSGAVKASHDVLGFQRRPLRSNQDDSLSDSGHAVSHLAPGGVRAAHRKPRPSSANAKLGSRARANASRRHSDAGRLMERTMGAPEADGRSGAAPKTHKKKLRPTSAKARVQSSGRPRSASRARPSSAKARDRALAAGRGVSASGRPFLKPDLNGTPPSLHVRVRRRPSSAKARRPGPGGSSSVKSLHGTTSPALVQSTRGGTRGEYVVSPGRLPPKQFLDDTHVPTSTSRRWQPPAAAAAAASAAAPAPPAATSLWQSVPHILAAFRASTGQTDVHSGGSGGTGGTGTAPTGSRSPSRTGRKSFGGTAKSGGRRRIVDSPLAGSVRPSAIVT